MHTHLRCDCISQHSSATLLCVFDLRYYFNHIKMHLHCYITKTMFRKLIPGNPGTRYLVSGARCVGVRFLVLGTWYEVSGTWYQVLGTWCMVTGTRCLAPGTRYWGPTIVPGARYLVGWTLIYLKMEGCASAPLHFEVDWCWYLVPG